MRKDADKKPRLKERSVFTCSEVLEHQKTDQQQKFWEALVIVWEEWGEECLPTMLFEPRIGLIAGIHTEDTTMP